MKIGISKMGVESNNKRIAKNTLLLYFRMLLTMGVSLYTVRVVLEALGDVDYGLYNVVGGVVVMFSFFSSTMATASQRFFAFELGKKNFSQLKKTFSVTMTIYCILALIIFVLAETVGLWFLNHKMVIPTERLEAANWVYQFSILSFIIVMIAIPYNAAIIAHERMNVYAYISIVEVILKLLIVYLLVVFSFDKLKLYAVLIFGVTFFTTIIYRNYCIKRFEECRYSFIWDKLYFKEIVSYSGWNLFGALAGIFNNQGTDIVLNLFFGPVVNASRAIASRINTSISQFVLNFLTATRPQITKYYAAGEKEEMLKLVFQSSKLSYLLLFVISMPVLLEADYILSIWLKTPPDYVVLFSRLTIIGTLIDSLSYPLMTAAQATGKIKSYQIIVGGTMLLSLPLGYTLLKLGYPSESVFYVSIGIAIICLFIRLRLLGRMISLSMKDYVKKVVNPLIIITVVGYLLPFMVQSLISYGIIRFLIVSFIAVGSALCGIYLFGFDINDRRMFFEIIKRKKNG